MRGHAVRHEPGAIRKHQNATAVEQAVLKLSGEARPVAEDQLTQAVTQTCGKLHNKKQHL